ncbi:Mitochondrial import receptor subunit TOM70 [Lamellibrachia satsuma]|nr:Mitochondrial import receptor subunit TOM70 [Lamellibrachia satsuma]
MAANIARNGGVTEGWSKWQIAIAVGTPIAIGAAGIWYYRSRSRSRQRTTDSKSKDAKKSAENQQQKQAVGPLERAQVAKNKGNKYFKGHKYKEAIDCYTEAISICPLESEKDLATFYQNRAAAYEHLENYMQVVTDCTKALDLNSKYIKALFRRAKAYEQKGDLTSCLEDVTAVCILEGFQNQQSLLMADRVLRELGKAKADAAYKNRVPVEPSPQFILTYFSAFANDPILNSIAMDKGIGAGEPTDSAESSEASEPEKHQDETPEKEMADEIMEEDGSKNVKTSPYQEALACLRQKRYHQIVRLCSAEIKLSNSTQLSEALLLRATFYLLRGEGNKALEDFDRLIDISVADKRVRSNALIKRGSLKMQNGQQAEALSDFASAIKDDPENSDIYHHRGQLHLLIDKVEEALKDFQQSVTLSPNFAVAHVQKCYTEYRLAFARHSQLELQSAMKSFEDTLEKFVDCAEGYALYGQALCDQQMFAKADENFKRAMTLEADNGNIYVHRGLLRLQWKQNIDEASRLINQALEVDDKCEFAYETLGTIEVQRGNLDKAIELFNKAINLAKTEVEMAHLFSLLDAAIAQSRVANKFGINVPTISSII